jgi:hypothetical protein
MGPGLKTKFFDLADPVPSPARGEARLGDAPVGHRILRRHTRRGQETPPADLDAADKFFDLARTTTSPFMRAYYQRVAARYLSTEGGPR